jgi:hypothetical protein
MDVTYPTTQTNVSRIRSLRQRGWSDRGIARQLLLPLSLVRKIIADLEVSK